MLVKKPPSVVEMEGRRRKRKWSRGYVVDTMVAFAAAVALTVLYINAVSWAQAPRRECSTHPSSPTLECRADNGSLKSSHGSSLHSEWEKSSPRAGF